MKGDANFLAHFVEPKKEKSWKDMMRGMTRKRRWKTERTS